jgi:predicted nucleic acid-binding protein
MTQRFGIDTSILVRLCTGLPVQDFNKVVASLTQLVEIEHVALFASSMVIAEAYVALRHHYAVSKPDAKAALRSVLTSGLVAPSGGDSVLQALASQRGCGLMDRLIALQYSAEALQTLTLDRKMAARPGVSRLGALRRGAQRSR